MTFLAPGFLFASLAVAAAIIALHFIVTRQPRSAILPTARFVPDTRATAIAAAKRPSDLLLMLLRVLVVLAAGAGLAKPVLTPSREATARVILVDVSRSARDSIATRDSVRAIYRDGDAVALFDSSARVVTANVSDTLAALAPTSRRGNLSAALIAALRAGSSLRDRADSLELVIVSPFAREEFDAATDSIRTLWPGTARLVRVGQLRTEDYRPGAVGGPAAGSGRLSTTGSVRDPGNVTGLLSISGDPGDPLHVTVGLAGRAATVSAHIERRGTENQTSRSASSSSASHANIEWPAWSRPRFAVARTVRDTVGGVMAGEAVLVAAFERQWAFPNDSLRGADVMARWVDGEPAAIERPDGTGCARSVAIPVSPVGDLVIRNEFVRFVTSLSGACVGSTSLIPADPAVVAKLEGRGGLAPRAAFQPLSDARSDLATWLLALAIAAALTELFVRRRRKDAQASAEKRSLPHEARAA